MINNVVNSAIHNIVISDHAPISVSFYPLLKVNKTKQWSFNKSLLIDEEFTSLIRDKTEEFFTLNINSVSSIQTIWEAFKATRKKRKRKLY